MSKWQEASQRAIQGSGTRPSWIRNNIAALQHGHVTAHDQRTYSMQHPRYLPDPSLTILQKKNAMGKKKKTADGKARGDAKGNDDAGDEADAGVIFGRRSGKNEASMKQIIQGHFLPSASGEEEMDYPLIGSRITFGKMPMPRSTKASVLLQRNKEAEKAKLETESQKDVSSLWRMPKWSKIGPKVVVWA